MRKNFAFSLDIQREFMSELMKAKCISQCVILCRCNRTEVYFCGSPAAPEYVDKLLAEYSKIPKEIFSAKKDFIKMKNPFYIFLKLPAELTLWS